MERAHRRRLYRDPMIYIGAGSLCSALARAIGTLWVAVPLLAVALGCLIVGAVKLVQAPRSLPPEQRRKERRSMLIGAVVPLVGLAALFGVLLLFIDE